MMTIYAQIAKAQAEMSNPHFDMVNPHFKSKFASLASVRNAVIPILAKHGVTVLQDVRYCQGGVEVYTILASDEGKCEFGPIFMPAARGDAQGLGSAITYARRYSLQTIAGVAGEEDDDGNAAVESTRRQKKADEEITKKIASLADIESLKALWKELSEEERAANQEAFSERRKVLEAA